MALTRFRVQTEEVKQDKLALFIFLFAVLSVLLQVSLILTANSNLPPQVPLFYSRPWGEPMLAPKNLLWILPVICACVTLINFSLALVLLKGRKFLERVLYIFSFIVATGTLYDAAKIIGLLT